jgi:hypothetical protein
MVLVQKDFRVPWILQGKEWVGQHLPSRTLRQRLSDPISGGISAKQRLCRCNTLSGSGRFGSHMPDVDDQHEITSQQSTTWRRIKHGDRTN